MFWLSLYGLVAQVLTHDAPFSFYMLQTKSDYTTSYQLKTIKEQSESINSRENLDVAVLQKFENEVWHWKDSIKTNGNRLQCFEFDAGQAEALALKIEKMVLPAGAKLFLYAPNEQNNFWLFDGKQTGFIKSQFISQQVVGSKLIIELNCDATCNGDLELSISGLLNYFQTENRSGPGFGQSTDCEVNFACSEGEGWCNEAQSVVRILIQSGTRYFYCSGAVVNNTANDHTPYVLTAAHCGENSSVSDFSYWKFDFLYQSEDCNSPSSESNIDYLSLTGCENLAYAERSGASGSDFRLLQLNDSIPSVWNIFYAGWNAEEKDKIETEGVCIHHPYGDIKKISTYTKPLLSTDAMGGFTNDLYWQTFWTETENGYGITEGGSSGSPLFNNFGQIIGTLATGSSYCDGMNESSPDFYGKFSKHWDDNGSNPVQCLKPWLDPLQLDVESWPGISGNEVLECGAKISFDQFTLYPVPADKYLKIGDVDLSTLSNADIIVYSINGTKMLEQHSSDSPDIKNIDVHSLPSGIYVLKVIKEGLIVTQKFVILHSEN